MTTFDTDTAVQRVGADLFSASIDRKWWVLRGPNGGDVAALLQRAMTQAEDDEQRPARSLPVHFIQPPDAGPVDIHAHVERQGGLLTSTSARLVQAERLIATG